MIPPEIYSRMVNNTFAAYARLPLEHKTRAKIAVPILPSQIILSLDVRVMTVFWQVV